MIQAPSPTGGILQAIENAPQELRESLAALIQGERFAHVGQLMLFLRDGSLTSDELQWQERELIYSGTLAELLKNGPAFIQAEFAETLHADDRLLDHDPLRGYLPKLEAASDLRADRSICCRLE